MSVRLVAGPPASVRAAEPGLGPTIATWLALRRGADPLFAPELVCVEDADGRITVHVIAKYAEAYARKRTIEATGRTVSIVRVV
ncbi:MAG: hypothetical protein NW200_04795 [Hyphomonadaceae bacterium]|nr:hypothetical protein [Hyphomonadaceae bacterium]